MQAEVAPEEALPVRQRIQARLDELNKNAAWLSEKVGVSRSTITRILKGDRNPTAQTLQDIAPVLGVTLAELVAGTDAAQRVKEAQDLVSRTDYEAAVHQVIEYERRANDLARRVQDLEEDLRNESDSRQRAEEEARASLRQVGLMRAERDQARREARHNELDARRYRTALEKAVAHVAQLRAEVRELGEAVEAGRRTARITKILAGVAAVASVANYLGKTDDDESEETRI